MPATYDCIATTTLGSNQASVTFSSISQNYTDLLLVANAKSDSTTNDYDALNGRVNSDNGANYAVNYLLGNGAVPSSEGYANQSGTQWARLSANKSFTGFDTVHIHFMNYSNTTTFKTMITQGASPQEYYKILLSMNLWRSTAAISTILLFPAVGPNFISGSRFTLYGIKAA